MDAAGFNMTLSNTLEKLHFLPAWLVSYPLQPNKIPIIAYSNFVDTWIHTDYVIRCNDNNYSMKVDNHLWKKLQ